MKATGIVRRIDDLGRVVVPKEIRRTLRIREGDPMEIFTDREGEIILKKYSPIGELGSFSQQYADAVYQAVKLPVLICDKDQFIAAAGLSKKEIIGTPIHSELEHAIEHRQCILARKNDKDYVNLCGSGSQEFHSQALSTIICAGDAVGAVVIISPKEDVSFDTGALNLATTGAFFLGKQMED
jgi:AbrB family transcriptional regulator (stage V sporulation protein T)